MSTVVDLIFVGLIMLTGEEGVDWEYHKMSLAWWQACLWAIRN